MVYTILIVSIYFSILINIKKYIVSFHKKKLRFMGLGKIQFKKTSTIWSVAIISRLIHIFEPKHVILIFSY